MINCVQSRCINEPLTIVNSEIQIFTSKDIREDGGGGWLRNVHLL